MSGMRYDDAESDRLEAVYLGVDMVAQRRHVSGLLNAQRGEGVIDIGSGPGFLAADIAAAVGPDGQVHGVDLSPQMVERATARNSHAWVSYAQADATAIPVEDARFDVAVSTQVAEYVLDIKAFCAEFARVMRPGGRGLVMATDWDAMVWHTEDQPRMNRMLEAFGAHCADRRLPRTLGARLADAGLRVTGVDVFPVVNTSPYEGSYSAGLIPFVDGYVGGASALGAEERAAWRQEQADLAARGAYFFATQRFSFLVQKPE